MCYNVRLGWCFLGVYRVVNGFLHENLDFAREVTEFDKSDFAERANSGNTASDSGGSSLFIVEIV